MLSPTCLGFVEVATEGTPVRIATAQTPCCRIDFHVPAGNSGITYVGVAGLNHSSGAGVIRALAKPVTQVAGDQFSIVSADGSNRLDASNYWIDAATSDDGLYVTYWQGV